tara:strand:- start:321 stop:551 length:231 start_codon:yes stop_codon:yes gene_type:complete
MFTFTKEQGGVIGTAAGMAIVALKAIPVAIDKLRYDLCSQLEVIASELSSCETRLNQVQDEIHNLKDVAYKLKDQS